LVEVDDESRCGDLVNGGHQSIMIGEWVI
jgi:hypothetical protein